MSSEVLEEILAHVRGGRVDRQSGGWMQTDTDGRKFEWSGNAAKPQAGGRHLKAYAEMLTRRFGRPMRPHGDEARLLTQILEEDPTGPLRATEMLGSAAIPELEELVRKAPWPPHWSDGAKYAARGLAVALINRDHADGDFSGLSR